MARRTSPGRKDPISTPSIGLDVEPKPRPEYRLLPIRNGIPGAGKFAQGLFIGLGIAELCFPMPRG